MRRLLSLAHSIVYRKKLGTCRHRVLSPVLFFLAIPLFVFYKKFH